MLRRVHLVIGLAAIVAFLLSGQLLGHHRPAMEQLPADLRMMYISRHVYLLAGALVNVALGLYLQLQPSGWRARLASHRFHPHSDFYSFLNYGLPHRATAWHGRTRLAKPYRHS